jgi:ketosteroid isomerase-like protein
MKLRMLLILPLLAASMTQAHAQPPQSKEDHDKLFQTIEALDAQLFDAYNKCDLEKLGSFFTEDLEFYHDQTGLSRGRQALVDAVKQNICGKVRRDLVKGTLEVYPLKSYGAVEIGVHRFCDPKTNQTCGEADSGVAKFVMLWQNTDGNWKITRVISFDHVSH